MFYFFVLGRGEGGIRGVGKGGGVRFFIENPRRGGSPRNKGQGHSSLAYSSEIQEEIHDVDEAPRNCF